jgi:signal transduction histidine kinase/DNA-binding response OmpR family regulator/ligand-binding sensor domain-containing protein
MKKIVALVILFIIVSGKTSSFAQQSKITFEHINSVPNMPCIFQDQSGYIWCGTYWGVYRYDPYSFKSYIPKGAGDTTFMSNVVVTDIPNLIIETICGDKEGNIWAGHSQGLEKLNPETNAVTHYRLNPNAPLTDWSNHVLALHEDHDGNLWIGTGGGLYLFDKTNETFEWIKHDSSDPGSIIQNNVNTIFETKDGTLWFGTGGGLEKYDRTTKRFIHYWNGEWIRSNYGDPNCILSIFESNDGTLWLGTTGGVVQLNRNDNSFTLYQHNPDDPQSLADNVVKSISEDLNGNLWIGTNEGIDNFNKHTKKFSHHKYDKNNPGSISGNNVAKILCDRSGAIWITTYGRGLNKYTPGKRYVKEYPLDKYGDLPDPTWNLTQDNQGKIWIGTDKELISFDPVNEVFKEEQLKTDIAGLLVDKTGTLWISIRTTGNLFFKKDGEEKINQFIDSEGKVFATGLSFMNNSSDGNIWLASDFNVLKLYCSSKKVEHIVKVDNWITYLKEDKSGLLWIGTDVGLICYDPENKTSTRFSYDQKDSLTIGGNAVADICEDGLGNLWATANSTLNKFDREKQKFIRWGGKDGLPNGAFDLETDALGNLWIFNGNAVKYNPVTKESNVFADFKFGTPYKIRNGEFYLLVSRLFGETPSLIRFHPDSLRNNEFIAPIVITDFRKFEKSSPFKKEIQLPYDENYLSFEFASLNFIHPEKNQYAYKMEGVDKDWVYSNTRRYASYPNLAPGEYVFRVKGSNNEGLWNEEGTSIAIIISPPWWKTWWAYSTYAAIFIFALYGIRRYELNRAGLKNKIKMDEAVLKEKEETDKMKSRFFANISHEFRTPLTLILGPAEKIFSNTSDNTIKDADIIRRNSRRLLQLINQLLDLSKLEAGKLKLETTKGNIVSFVKGVALSFESLAESKDITLKLLPENEFIEMYFDKEKMMKILTNILSNAFKFTPEEGTVTVSITTNPPSFPPILKGELNGGSVEIKIKDTGIGIAQEEIPKLFDRFYQVDNSQTREYEGTGIGLALTKELVELHHGRINVESVKGEWTEFTLEFPLGREHLKDEEIIEEKTDVILNGAKNHTLAYGKEDRNETSLIDSSSRTPQNDGETKEEKTIILVVEDNYDMREYIKESLDGNYLIEEAVNGEQGVRKAEKLIPDLIISDMMMPKLDGNELVRILKNDEKTSHIPIIILTAKAGQENKLEGLETGADDYLTKPFDIKELQVRIKNLISIRKKLQEKFSKLDNHFPSIKGLKLSSLDEKFMLKVSEVIEKHLAEEEFSIEEFGKEVGMSRSQFHRKFTAITGKTASMYLRSMRLSRAKKMIEEKTGNISEIAFSAGFSSVSYFSKCFKEEFGYPPSDLL